MNVKYEMSIVEAEDKLASLLQDYPNSCTVTIAIGNNNQATINTPGVAAASKITLIKFMRQVAEDAKCGKLLFLSAYDDGHARVTLADAKHYVETYFNC